MKTKRSFFVVIALLVILDIAAAFWYIANRLNSDDEASNPLNAEKMALRNEVADSTILGETVPDKFEITEKSQYFVSTSPVTADKPRTHWTSIKRYKGRIPVSINGSEAIGDLLKEIEHRAFGLETGSISTCAATFLKTPRFNSNSPFDYKQVASEPHIAEVYGNVATIKIFPTFTSDYLLVMAIDKQNYDGYRHTEHMSFVIYNRKRHQVLNQSNIFNRERNQQVLNLINAHIDELNAAGSSVHLSHAGTLPPEITLGRKGVLFVFDSGAIADSSEGIINVFVSYAKLRSCFTQEFKAIVDSNNGFWDYEPVKFSD